MTADPPEQTFLFADLAGYTALTEAHGDDQAADAAEEFCEAVRALLAQYDAEEVKAIGDALLVRVPDATKAARLAVRIVGDYGTRHRALGIRIGVHTGTAVRRGDDWFGSAVNVAARVANLAEAGQVLITEATRRALNPSLVARDLGSTVLKNVADPVQIYELEFAAEASVGALPIDPVCHMAVEPERAAANREIAGRTYYLCSLECAAVFDRDASRYLTR